jgi:hypothetical protein
MLPGRVVPKLLDNTESTKFVPLEDVLFTGIIGEKIGLKLYGTSAFCYEVSFGQSSANPAKKRRVENTPFFWAKIQINSYFRAPKHALISEFLLKQLHVAFHVTKSLMNMKDWML